MLQVAISYYHFNFCFPLPSLPTSSAVIMHMKAMDPLVHLFPELRGVEVHSLAVKVQVMALTFLATSIIFALSYIASFRFTVFKYHLRTKEKIFWCLAFVRAVWGFIAAFFGFWYLAIDNTLHIDVVHGNSESTFLVVYVCVGFFAFECLALFTSNFLFGNFDSFLTAHHLLSLTGYSIVAYYGKAHFFAVVGMLLEMTTPFTCLCWMLLKAKLSHHWIWKANQILLVHLFHCRTTVEGYFFFKSYYHWENIGANMPTAIMIMLYTQLTAQFFVLTPYWSYKKMMQLFNPVDWNHPDLQSEKLRLQASTNGHSAIPNEHTTISNGFIPIQNDPIPNGHDKRD